MHREEKKVVIVVTSHSELGETEEKTGYHLEELAVPYLELKKAGARIIIASPMGGTPPVDPKSAQKDSAEIQEFKEDLQAQRSLAKTIPVSEIEGKIDLLFFPGGRGPMWDLASSKEVAHLVEEVWRDGGIVAALCHGPAALLNALDENGEPLVAGKRINSFTDDEERAGGHHRDVPFLLESRLRELGARFESGPKGKAYVVRDGRLVTGQNPASAKAVAEQALFALETESSDPDRDLSERERSLREQELAMGMDGRVNRPGETRLDVEPALAAGIANDPRHTSPALHDDAMSEKRAAPKSWTQKEVDERVGSQRRPGAVRGRPDDEVTWPGKDVKRASSKDANSRAPHPISLSSKKRSSPGKRNPRR